MLQLIFNLILVDVVFHLGIFGFFLLAIIGTVFMVITLYNLVLAMCKTTKTMLGIFNLPKLEIGDNYKCQKDITIE